MAAWTEVTGRSCEQMPGMSRGCDLDPERATLAPFATRSVSMADYLELDPATTDRRQIYRMLVGSVVPRPIGWASTVDADGRANLAPFSFFTVVCVVPPMISLTIARNPDGSEKHTLKNVRQTGEFCFNLVTHNVWKEMVDSANGFPEGDSEFEITGLT